MNGVNFDNALARAQQLMLDESWQNQVSFAERAQSKSQRMSGGIGGSNDLAALESQVFSSSSSSPTNNLPQETYNPTQRYGMVNENGRPIEMLQQKQRTPQESRLPKEIAESFSKMGPLSGDDAAYMPSAVASQLPSRQMIKETYGPAPVQQVQPSNGGVDYEYIKYLIKEAIRESKNELLTESAAPQINAMRFAEGNRLQFLDKKGNLYEAKLTLVKKGDK